MPLIGQGGEQASCRFVEAADCGACGAAAGGTGRHDGCVARFAQWAAAIVSWLIVGWVKILFWGGVLWVVAAALVDLDPGVQTGRVYGGVGLFCCDEFC